MVVKDRIVAGLANMSIKEDVLAHDSLKEWTVNDLVTYVEGKESSKTSTGLMNTKNNAHAASAGAVGTTKKCDKCSCHHDSARCGAEGQTCYNCNSKGHLSRYCHKPKKKKQEKVKKAAAVTAEAGPEVKAEAVKIKDDGH